jgi:hypothetical protein
MPTRSPQRCWTLTSRSSATDGPLGLIDRLARSASGLRTAMSSGDTAEIEKAMRAFRESMSLVEQIGAWRHDPILKQRIHSLLPELDSSRMLAALLADMTGQRAEALASAHPSAIQPTYGRRTRA